MRRFFIILAVLIVIVAGGLVWFTTKQDDSSVSPATNSSATTHTDNQAKPVPPAFDKSQFSLTDPTSIWVVVNKLRPLNPKNYAPSDLVVPNVPLRVPGNETMQLRKPAATALESLFAGAKTAGFDLMLSSGYRSYSYQVSLYGSYVAQQGQAAADTFSARPGYSEHQTGLAADVEATSRKCEVEQCFGDTPEGKWLAANAYKYGFLIRYPQGKEDTTGYEYEPWHVRYIGIPLATELHKEGISTLEEFFELPPAPNYAS